MSITTDPTVTIATAGATSAATAPPATGASPLPRIAGGLALVAFPLLLTAGIATSPPQESAATRDYMASLGADPALSAISAGLLHYSWVVFALGVLATIGLVRGRRGRLFVPLAAVVTSFSAIQISGLLLGDWYASAMTNALGADKAAELFEAANGDPWVSTWLLSGQFVGFVGIPLVIAALARAGVVSWWLLLAPVAAFGAFFVPLPFAVAAGMFVGAAPMILVGVRLLQRASARVRREEIAA